jgi:hypothetical protein
MRMSAHYVPQPLVRTTILLTPEQREALANESARTGKPVTQLVRDLVDARFFHMRMTVAGWPVSGAVERPLDTTQAPPPPRARLREWVSRSGGGR